jgi:hypothetical protein
MDTVHESVPPNTTVQEDLTTAGQRHINLIWEVTQAILSVLVVSANVIVGVNQGITPLHGEFPVVLSSALFLVVGFYFSRTNHTNVGGIGPKKQDEYVGR